MTEPQDEVAEGRCGVRDAQCLIHCCAEDDCAHIDHAGIQACSEKPEDLAGAPLGMYHCPVCGCMVLAGIPHVQHDYGCLLGLDIAPATS